MIVSENRYPLGTALRVRIMLSFAVMVTRFDGSNPAPHHWRLPRRRYRSFARGVCHALAVWQSHCAHAFHRLWEGDWALGEIDCIAQHVTRTLRDAVTWPRTDSRMPHRATFLARMVGLAASTPRRSRVVVPIMASARTAQRADAKSCSTPSSTAGAGRIASGRPSRRRRRRTRTGRRAAPPASARSGRPGAWDRI